MRSAGRRRAPAASLWITRRSPRHTCRYSTDCPRDPSR
jgi:hypothetical protein